MSNSNIYYFPITQNWYYEMMKNRFKDAVVIITGGASGIGKALADQLGAQGARIIIADRDAIKGAKVAEALVAKQQDAIYKQVDLVDIAATKILFDFVAETYGTIDYVFNDAGIFMGGEIRDTPIDRWHEVVRNNIFAVMNGAHFAYQVMLKQGHGSIINLGSAAGLFPVPAMGIYGSTKFAIVGLTLALRNEAKELGIKVSVVCPTIVDTPLYDTALYNKIDVKKLLRARKTLQQPDITAQRIIQGVIKNRATIHTATSTKFAWLMFRIAPWAYNLGSVRIIRAYRQKYRQA